MSLRSSAMHGTALGVCVAGSHATFPPLSEPRHSHVVQCHLGVGPQDAPSLSAHAQAEIRLLPRDERWVKAPSRLEGGNPHHGISTAGVGLTNRSVPFEIGQAVINRMLGKPLPATPADDSHV